MTRKLIALFCILTMALLPAFAATQVGTQQTQTQLLQYNLAGYYFYVVGSTVYAKNNTTGAIDYSGTDTVTVVNNAMSNNSAVCGHLDFGPYTFPINSWTAETTTGFTNRSYAFGIPGQPSSSQLCTWVITAAARTTLVDQFGDPVQTTGTVFSVNSSPFTALSSSTVPVVWWPRPSSGVNNISADVTFSDFTVRFPSNQINGNMEAIDCAAASNCAVYRVHADTNVVQTSIAQPITPTVSGAAAFVTTASEHEENHFVDNDAMGFYNGYNIQTDHIVFENNYANECMYAENYGVSGVGTTGTAINYSGTFINGGWGECAHGLTIGTLVQNGSLFTWEGLNWEDATSGGSWPWAVPVYHAKELTSGNTVGTISYNPGTEGNAGAVPTTNLFDGGGGTNIALCAVGYSCKSTTGTGNTGSTVTTSTAMTSGVDYLANSSTQLVFTLPASSTQNSEQSICGEGSGGWSLQSGAGQTIWYNGTTPTGVFSVNQYDCITVKTAVANTDFSVKNASEVLSSTSCSTNATNDTFGGTAGVLLSAHTDGCGNTWALYNAITGDPAGTAQLNGSYGIVSTLNTSTYPEYRNSLSPASANYTTAFTAVKAGSSTSGTTAGLFMRASSSAYTGYIAQYVDGTGLLLYKVVTGTANQIGSTTSVSWAFGAPHTLSCTISGSSTTIITCYDNGAQWITYSDSSSPITASGYVVMKMASSALTQWTFSNFQVHP